MEDRVVEIKTIRQGIARLEKMQGRAKPELTACPA